MKSFGAQSSPWSEREKTMPTAESPQIRNLEPEAMRSTRILIAGVGNIFFGDDAFGVETVAELLRHRLPEGVEAVDFGIRSYDLAYALSGGYEAVILVDATPRGGRAGTVYVLELDLDQLPQLSSEGADAHKMDPARVIQMARSLGCQLGRMYLVGCEPGRLEPVGGDLSLSAEVQSAVPRAVETILSLVSNLLGGRVEEENTKADTGLVPV
jgi:hydrogenase maturation protease